MSHQVKWEHLKAIHARHRQAARPLKQRSLDEFCQGSGDHRKHARRLLNGPPPEPPRPRARRRAPLYGPRASQVLAAMWTAAGSPGSVRLQAWLPRWRPWARARVSLAPDRERPLLARSPRQMARRRQPHKRRVKKRQEDRANPGARLQRHIPLRT